MCIVKRHEVIPVMNDTEIKKIIAEYSYLPETYWGMVRCMCPGNVTRSELIEGIREITFHRRASTYYDDDTYWLAQSPFDKRWYLFVSGMGSPMPSKVSSIESERPRWFDED